MGQVEPTGGLPEIRAAGGPAGFGLPRLGDHVMGCGGLKEAPDVHASGAVVSQSGSAAGDVLGQGVGVRTLLQAPLQGLTDDPATALLLLGRRWVGEVQGSGHIECVYVFVCVFV